VLSRSRQRRAIHLAEALTGRRLSAGQGAATFMRFERGTVWRKTHYSGLERKVCHDARPPMSDRDERGRRSGPKRQANSPREMPTSQPEKSREITRPTPARAPGRQSNLKPPT
jgi:hypothetical protein